MNEVSTFSMSLASLLGADPNTGEGARFDPESGSVMEHFQNPAAVEQSTSSALDNMLTDKEGGMLPHRDATGAKKKQTQIEGLIQLKQGSFLPENKGKLLAILSGTALKMVGAHNQNAGLFIAGSAISGLAEKELDNWNTDWNMRIADAMQKGKENASTIALRRQASERIQENIDRFGPAKDEADATRRLAQIQEDVTPENINSMLTGEPSPRALAEKWEIKQKQAGQEVYSEVASSIIQKEYSAHLNETGLRETLMNAPLETQIADIKEWRGKKLKTQDPNYQALAILDDDALAEEAKQIHGTGGAMMSEHSAEIGLDVHSKKYTPANSFFIENSPMAKLAPEKALDKAVQLTPRTIKENPILSSTAPGARRYGDVVKNIMDNLPDVAVVKKDPSTGKKFLYVPVGEKEYEVRTPLNPYAPAGFNSFAQKDRKLVKLLPNEINSGVEWREILNGVITKGTGYDSEFQKYLSMLTTEMLGPPKFESIE
ncbi:MAG: hypothetical protein ABIK92_21750 [Pseudomonadota bacterium]